jgi:hypothetical protein
MKKYWTLFTLTVIIFATITISTAKIETPSDGNDTYGFPLTFLEIYGGKRDYYPDNDFSFLTFGFDILTTLIITIIGWRIYTKQKLKQKKSGT